MMERRTQDITMSHFHTSSTSRPQPYGTDVCSDHKCVEIRNAVRDYVTSGKLRQDREQAVNALADFSDALAELLEQFTQISTDIHSHSDRLVGSIGAEGHRAFTESNWRHSLPRPSVHRTSGRTPYNSQQGQYQPQTGRRLHLSSGHDWSAPSTPRPGGRPPHQAARLASPPPAEPEIAKDLLLIDMPQTDDLLDSIPSHETIWDTTCGTYMAYGLAFIFCFVVFAYIMILGS